MKIVIANTDIHQDAEGRFSLNDLHKASGAEERHEPNNFLRIDTTQALIAEISNSAETQNKNPITTKAGRYGGSYGAKELIYAYAMWISPKFHLRVIRTFDEVVTEKAGRTALPNPARLFPDYFKVARLIGLDKNVAAISANQAVLQKTGENVLQLLGQTHLEAEKQELYYTPTELGTRIAVSGRGFNAMLTEAGLQTKLGEHWQPTPAGEKYCRVLDTGKRHGSGAMIQQVKWSETVLPYVNDILSQQEKAA